MTGVLRNEMSVSKILRNPLSRINQTVKCIPKFNHYKQNFLEIHSSASVLKKSMAPMNNGKACRIAVAQMTSTNDQEKNFETCKLLAEKAAIAQCSFLFLPENFSFLGTSQNDSVSIAQPLDGPLMTRYRSLARDHNLWLSLGGFQETGPDPDHVYNTHVIVDSQGEIRSTYRKIHLFDVDVPNGPSLRESRTTAPGSKLVTCRTTPLGTIGLTVCYDLRFPELYQQLTWEKGAQTLVIPAAFTHVTGKAHWELLLRARAVECQSFVVAAAQAGQHNEKRTSYGRSLVVDPWGEVVAALEDPWETGVAVAEIDLARVGEVRSRMPIQRHREQGHRAYFGTEEGATTR